MFKIKAPDGTNNLCGKNVKRLRENYNPPLSQRALAKKLQLAGYDVDNHFIRRVELGERFVTDIEIKMLAECFQVSTDALLR
ncbi:MAG: helix-turn-helix transcriptional regulator [Christensenella sp.]|uniref:helix-turn-helix domain-containing protein n=1 Tax=Christensenella sp. TaxID=1935934 RepID=UPI002B20E817|nr:helix-turn-helix transcriptional regulator [Christensenella sp.]MEA5003535.1 helix-turn-helix transcriptional regulator [Christensenella sp.]